MKIAYNWLKQFLPFTQSPQEISILLTGCGLEVEHLEHWQSLQGGLAGIVVGQILTCMQHPNADRLKITTVEVGDGEPKQIVCGAPNVAAGQKVIVALPAAILFPSHGDSFTIKNSKIRGETSEGMICAEDEIGLGESHAGIMILPEDTQVGLSAADYFQVEQDWIFEIGLTPNRADAASHLGVARDLKALLGKANNLKLTLPDVNDIKVEKTSNAISVEVKDVNSCLRYSGIQIDGVRIEESPTWLKNKLKSIGVRSINNIVDIGNYVMFAVGQPMHAFDADKIAGNKITVGTLKKGDKFTTLDEVEHELNGTELMIADDNGGLCIAGVFGGMHSGVSSQTTNLFLESACFNPVQVRKAARAHGLHTDSSFRFERGTDPEITVYALKFAAKLITELAGGKVSSDIIDIYPEPVQWKEIILSLDYVNMLAGNDLAKEEIIRILTDLQIRIVKESDQELILSIPPFKVEVTRQADVVEEILRIYGYNTITLPKKLSISVAAVAKPDPEAINYRLGEWLVANGFNEILNNSLTKISSTDVIALPENSEAIKVLNPLSNDLGMLRHTMLLTGLESLSYNINRKQKDLKFFETGKTYLKINNRYHEQKNLALWISGNRHEEHWKIKATDFDIYYLKAIVSNLLESIGVNTRTQLKLSEYHDATFAAALKFEAKGKQIVVLGLVNKPILKSADVSQQVLYAEFNLDALMKLVPVKDEKAKEAPKYPEVRRDLSMLLDRSVHYDAIEQLAYSTEPKLLKNVNLFDVYEGEKIGEGKKSYALAFTLSDEESTLQDKQIDGVMNKLMKQFEEKLGAQIRKN